MVFSSIPFLLLFLPGVLLVYFALAGFDQIARRIGASNGLSFLTMTDALGRAKSVARLYYKTDTHWTGAGIQVVEAAVLARIGRSEPVSTTVERMTLVNGGDLARMLNGPAQYAETILSGVPTSIPEPIRTDGVVSWLDASTAQTFTRATIQFVRSRGSDRVLMFGDSFGESLAPYLATHFGTLTFVPMHPDAATFTALVEQFYPDLVIEERTERYLKYPPRQVPFADRRKGWMAAE